MMQTFDRQYLLNLLNEYAFWYQSLARRGPLPRALSGINARGEQFLIRLDDIHLGHQERHELISTILREEQAECYAYGGVSSAQASGREGAEQLTLIVATSTYFVMGEWSVYRKPSLRFEQRELWEGDNPEEVPAAWFLTNAATTGSDVERYRSIWRELRPQARFLQRPEESTESESSG
jgi:hypothetical protein